MTKKSLTDLTIRKLTPDAAGRYDVWDTNVRGFGVRVFKSGVKSFFLSYHMSDRKRRDTLGRYPDVSLADARKLAYERRAQIARGEDPVARTTANSKTFKKVVGDFIERHILRHNKESTQLLYKMIIRNEFLPIWGNRPIHEIERKDIITVLDQIMSRGSPGTANNAYAIVSKFFNWCISRDLVKANPCIGVERPAKLKSRERILTDHELGKIWAAADRAGYPFGTIITLLILTGQRRGEVVNMEWDQIDWGSKVWNLPSKLTKNKKAHSLPLSKPAIEIIQAIPQINNQKFVFPAVGSTTTTFSGFSKSKRRLDEKAQIDDWRIHDLRRTAATGMAMLGVPPHVIERVLNHSSGQLGGIAGVYNRYQYLDEMSAALELWAEHLMAL